MNQMPNSIPVAGKRGIYQPASWEVAGKRLVFRNESTAALIRRTTWKSLSLLRFCLLAMSGAGFAR